MTKKQLEHFKKIIMEKREQLLREMDLLKESGLNETQKESSGEHSAYSFHMADQGTDTMEREKAFLFASRGGNFLYHLELALERIEKGDYGNCVDCGKEISHERLEAVPHARLCIECKSKEERSKA
jgi:DnaK suppressor protein